jgi:putative hydrolase of HD superfamily
MNDDQRVVHFLFEAGFLQNMQRTGVAHLGSGQQSIAEHSFRATVIGYTLASMLGADVSKVLKMCLFHDLEEARTGDLNYLQQRYVKSDDEKALRHAVSGLPMEDELLSVIGEFAAQETLEAKVAKDADALELILFLKEQLDKGNEQAANWIRSAVKRLKTEKAVQIAETIMETRYYEWWYGDGNGWENGTKNW